MTFIVNVVTVKLLNCLKVQINLVEGHSLAQISAAVSNGSIELEDGLKLIDGICNSCVKANLPFTVSYTVHSNLSELSRSLPANIFVSMEDTADCFTLTGVTNEVENFLNLLTSHDPTLKVNKKINTRVPFHTPLLNRVTAGLKFLSNVLYFT